MNGPTGGGVLLAGFSRRDLARRFASLGFTRGAEIGVRQGAFSLCLCQTVPGLQLRCVDPWRNYTKRMPAYSQDRNYQVAVERLRPYGATIVRALSTEAVLDVPPGSLDFVYIDANHEYGHVWTDLVLWSACVRAGGIVSGDDYGAPGVRRAVDQFVDEQGIADWWLTDDPTRRNRKGQIFTSWFWVQP